jgi:hypothetical protein
MPFLKVISMHTYRPLRYEHISVTLRLPLTVLDYTLVTMLAKHIDETIESSQVVRARLPCLNSSRGLFALMTWSSDFNANKFRRLADQSAPPCWRIFSSLRHNSLLLIAGCYVYVDSRIS